MFLVFNRFLLTVIFIAQKSESYVDACNIIMHKLLFKYYKNSICNVFFFLNDSMKAVIWVYIHMRILF